MPFQADESDFRRCIPPKHVWADKPANVILHRVCFMHVWRLLKPKNESIAFILIALGGLLENVGEDLIRKFVDTYLH